MAWAWSGMRGGAVICWGPRLMVAVRSGRSAWTIFLMLTPVRAGLCLARDRECGEHDGQVGLDAVADPVEHRPCGQVGLGHPEGPLDLVELVVRRHHVRTIHGVGVDVGDVALQPGKVAGPLNQVPVHALDGVGDLDEPVLLQRRVPAATASARSIILLIARLSC